MGELRVASAGPRQRVALCSLGPLMGLAPGDCCPQSHTVQAAAAAVELEGMT